MLTRHGQLPDFLVVGAAKSGTASLYAYLRQHPRVFMPIPKEPHFFSYAGTEWDSRVPARTLPEYASLFTAASPDQRIGEASTSYFYEYERTIRRIREAYGDAARNLRIIIMLRDPAERVFSLYSMYALCGFENLPADQAIAPGSYCRLAARVPGTAYGIPFDYLRSGLSYDAIRSYLKAFPRTMIIRYPDFSANARATTVRTLSFLGLTDIPLLSCAERWHRSGVPRNRLLNRLLNFSWQFASKRRQTPLTRRIIFNIDVMASKNIRPACLPPALRATLERFFHDDMAATERLIRTRYAS